MLFIVLFLSPCTLFSRVHFIISLGYLCIHWFGITCYRKKLGGKQIYLISEQRIFIQNRDYECRAY